MQKVKIQCKGTFEYLIKGLAGLYRREMNCASQCQHQSTNQRCRLGPESIRASVCLQAWNRVDSLDTIFEEDEDFFGETD